ncbi:hypothetical protein SprV_0702412400 [Sparganum proliferum]
MYIGHTGRRLGTHINELAIRRRDPLSLLFVYTLECGHQFNWDSTVVIVMANTKRKREFSEAWYSDAASVNHHVDVGAHYEGLRSRLTDPNPNRTSTTANTAAQSFTDPPSILPLQRRVPLFLRHLSSPLRPPSATHHDFVTPPHRPMVCLSCRAKWNSVTIKLAHLLSSRRTTGWSHQLNNSVGRLNSSEEPFPLFQNIGIANRYVHLYKMASPSTLG